MEEFITLFSDASSTVVMMALLAYMVVKQPSRLQEAMNRALTDHTRAVISLARSIEQTNTTYMELIRHQGSRLDALHKDLSALTRQVDRLAYLLSRSIPVADSDVDISVDDMD
jgi:uncharacterized protein Yka (UPF0111/DUF47 family)